MVTFSAAKPLIGMVHLRPLPGSPGFDGDLDAVFRQALEDTKTLCEAGIHGIIVENFGDIPYLPSKVEPLQLACMAAVTRDVVGAASVPVGVNVQFNDYEAELHVAYAAGASFIRVEVFVDTVVSAQGFYSPCSAQVLRLRKQLHMDDVEIWADIQPKHTRSLLPGDLVDSALEAVEAGADRLIVTGAATGQATPLDAVRRVKDATGACVFIGSGVSRRTVEDSLRVADGAIVGSSIKEEGNVHRPVDAERTRALVTTAAVEAISR